MLILDILRRHKEKYPSCDMPPTVVAESEGKLLALVTAPRVNKKLGFHAAEILRQGSEAITIALDARCNFGEGVGEYIYVHRVTEDGDVNVFSMRYHVLDGNVCWEETVTGQMVDVIHKRLFKLMMAARKSGVQSDVFNLLIAKGYQVEDLTLYNGS